MNIQPTSGSNKIHTQHHRLYKKNNGKFVVSFSFIA